MRKSAHKDIFNYLQQVIPGANKGQMYRRVCLMASLVQACIHNGHCRLESLSEATDAYRGKPPTNTILPSPHRLLTFAKN